MPSKRNPKSYYFSRLYSEPFHRDEKRLSQINLLNFDPFAPENRQSVANCKKHRRQGHELSDKCKHVLAIIDAQEKLLSVKPPDTGAGNKMNNNGNLKDTDISIKFGDGIPEIAKEYIKNWISKSGLIQLPYSRIYDVHEIRDDQNRDDLPSIVMLVPMIDDVSLLEDETILNKLFEEFKKDPIEFSKKFKVGNVRIYSRNKSTGEHDALGLKNYLPLKIIGNKFIGKDLKKAVIENIDVDFLGEKLENVSPDILTDINEIKTRIKEYSLKEKKLHKKREEFESILREYPKKIEELELKIRDKKSKNIDFSEEKSNIDKLNDQINDAKENLEKLEIEAVKNQKYKNTIDQKINSLGSKLSKENNKKIINEYKEKMSKLDEEIEEIKEEIKYRENQKIKAKILNTAFSDVIAPQKVKTGPINPDINPIGIAMQIAETVSVNIPKKILTLRSQLGEEKTKEKTEEKIEEIKRQKEQYKKDIEERKKDKFNIKFGSEIDSSDEEKMKLVDEVISFMEHLKGIKEGEASKEDANKMNDIWVAIGGDANKVLNPNDPDDMMMFNQMLNAMFQGKTEQQKKYAQVESEVEQEEQKRQMPGKILTNLPEKEKKEKTKKDIKEFSDEELLDDEPFIVNRAGPRISFDDDLNGNLKNLKESVKRRKTKSH